MKSTNFLLLLILMSCNNTKEKVDDKINKSVTVYSDSSKYIMLISATIDLPELQQFYRVQETLNQKELVLLNNEILNNKFIGGIDKLKKFNLPIKLMNETEIREMGIKAYLEYREINIRNDTASVYYRYDVQGVGIESIYLFKNNQWKLLNTESWEN